MPFFIFIKRSKSIDFVVCDEKMNIIACIELDDRFLNTNKT